MRVLCTLSARRVGDETVEYDRVKVDRVLLCHQIMNNLQHRPIKRSSMVKTEDIVLDPVSNAMNISKGRNCFEPTVMLSASSIHDGHVLYQKKVLIMMWVAGNLHLSCQWCSKLISIKIDGGRVNIRVEDLNKFRAIIGFIL